ncbi:PH domain-containing protein [Brevundimonas sp.]|uniref:PH domain-containing protein n=1 Tax=Brevundimonas sp. TaxID=1871086 RepID=UPI003567E111
MAWFDGVLGNASGVTAEEATKEFGPVLGQGERVVIAYKLVRDYVVFTDLRLLLVDKQGITGKKIEFHSIPYKSISHFSVETAGTFDFDAELKLWISSAVTPIQKRFSRAVNIFEVQALLAKAVCGTSGS